MILSKCMSHHLLLVVVIFIALLLDNQHQWISFGAYRSTKLSSCGSTSSSTFVSAFLVVVAPTTPVLQQQQQRVIKPSEFTSVVRIHTSTARSRRGNIFSNRPTLQFSQNRRRDYMMILQLSRLQMNIQMGCRTRRQCYSTIIPTKTSSSSSTTSMNSAIGAIDQLIQSSPYTTAAILCGIKASTADYIAQKRQLRKRNDNINIKSRIENMNANATTPTPTPIAEKEQRTDYSRNIAFLLYGAFYQGMGQEYIYNHLYPVYFGTGTNLYTVLIKVAFDLFLQTTLLTLPVAYSIKAMIYKYSFKEAIRRYIDDIVNHGLLLKYFTLWGPVQCLTFSIIPEHYRITFIAVVSFFWLIILSSISSRVRNTASAGTSSMSSTSSSTAENSNDITVNADTTLLSLTTSQECELVDGLTCNIDG